MGAFARFVVPVVMGSLLVGCAGNDAADSTSSASSPTSQQPTSAPPAENVQPIPGTRVALRVPEGLRVDPSLPGLGRPQSRTSVVVLDQAQSTGEKPSVILDEIAASFRDEDRAAREGLKLGEPQRTEVAGHPAVIATGTQDQAGTTYGKVLVALAPPESLVLLTGTLEPDDPLGTDGLLAVLREAQWTDERAPGDLGIDITGAPGYEVVPSSGAMQFSLGGGAGADVPIFIAAPSLGQAPVAAEQRRSTAQQRFGQLPGSPVPHNVTETTIADLPGWEITGESQTDVVYAAMVFTAGGYVLLTGLQPKGQPDQLPAFRQMADSLVVTR